MTDVLLRSLGPVAKARGDTSNMLSALDRLASSHRLAAMLRHIVTDGDAAKRVSASSVRHANGFDKLVLASIGGYQLRLHIWHATDGYAQRPLENAHNHRWPFATRIITGSYTATTFETSDGGSYLWNRYSPGNRERYRMEPVGPAELKTTSVVDYREQSAYWLSPAVIHRVSPIDPRRTVASLVVVAPPTRATTDVFVPLTGEAEVVGATRHEPMSRADVVSSVTALATAAGIL